MNAAEKAVSHILLRVLSDPNYRYYMLGTESLHLCLIADAERRGISLKECESQFESNLKAVNLPPPLCKALESEIRDLNREVGRLEKQLLGSSIASSEPKPPQPRFDALRYLAETTLAPGP